MADLQSAALATWLRRLVSITHLQSNDLRVMILVLAVNLAVNNAILPLLPAQATVERGQSWHATNKVATKGTGSARAGLVRYRG